MSKNGSSNLWKWLLGGAVLTAGGIVVAKALTTEPYVRVPEWWEKHGWDPRGYKPMPASALEEIRRDVQRYYAERGLKLDAKLIGPHKYFKGSLQIDASPLSLADKQKLYKIRFPEVSQYGLTGSGVDFGTAHTWEAIRGETPVKK